MHMAQQMEESTSYAGLMHAGAGSGLALVQVSALIPGLLPFIALAAVFALPLLLPVLVLGILAAPPAGVWWLVKRIRARHRPV
jgi:uncharacterized membrane-anchored protein